MKTRAWVYSLVVTLCVGAAWANDQVTVYVGRDGACGEHTPCYSTIQNAIDSVPSPSTIKITQETYYEDVVLDVNQVMALEGGWDTSFVSSSFYTTIIGSMRLADGTMIIEGPGRIILSSPPPTINGFSANPGTINSGQSSTLSWTITHAVSASIDQGVGSVNPVSGSVSVSPAATTTYTLTATNGTGSNTAQATVTVTPNRPTINVFSVSPTMIDYGQSSKLSWTITNATSASIDQEVGSVNPVSGSVSVSPAATTTYTLTATNAGGFVTAQVTVAINTSPPPDPGTVAPPVDPTVATTVSTATSFLYTGPNPIQTGVSAGTIDVKRAAVLRGKVMTSDSQPLSTVTVSILSHPEYGQTLSRLDGMFDLAVNGGGFLTVNYEKSGYLPVHRQVNVPWQDFVWLPEVIMIPVDTQVTSIDLTKPDPIQVARGNVVTDNVGSRQATLLIPAGTTATLVNADGTTQGVSTLNVRATEYTVGTNGPKAMPAELPPTTGYTYCVELSADEAISAGAQGVQFSQPIAYYLENYLNASVGSIVPVGYYDRVKGVWIPSDSGQVIKIISITGSPAMAQIDTDGDGVADSGLGITDAERQYLAALYTAGQELWRVPINHFSSWDCNWAVGPPPDARRPRQKPPKKKGDERDPCEKGGSIIGCQSQTLGEAIDIAGTPFSFHYQSDRVPGRKTAYSLEIPLSDDTVPDSLTGIELEIYVAGRKFTHSLSRDVPCLHYCLDLGLRGGGPDCPPPTPPGNDILTNQQYTFTWDGKDAYGRSLQGSQPIIVRIGYVYCGIYMSSAAATDQFEKAFGGLSGIQILGSRSGQFIFWQEWNGSVGPSDARGQGLGGWTVNVHHAYDPGGRILYQGDDKHRDATSIGYVITTVAGGGHVGGDNGDGGPAAQASLSDPVGVAVGPDGSLYIVDRQANRIRWVGADGIITTVAGTGCLGYSGDGGPATMACLYYPLGVAVSPDGSLYIADYYANRIRRVRTDGIITTFAGTGTFGYGGDGGLATNALLYLPEDVAVGPDGSLYIADGWNNRIRRVGTDGIITTVAGNGQYGSDGDGGPARDARLAKPTGVAVGPDGSLYIAESEGYRIRRVGTDGIISTIAGTGVSGYSGDGGPAINAQCFGTFRVALGPDGDLYIADTGNYRIRRVGTDGIITTVAGTGQYGYSGDGGPATNAGLSPGGVAVGPDGYIYIADRGNKRIRRVGSIFAGVGVSDIILPSEDGGKVYIFNSEGRHLRTIHALTGSVLYQFGYDAGGLLITITDGNGNVNPISRDSNGNPTAIIGPFGQTTTLSLNANGYLASLANPAGETYQFSYTDDGLLTSLTDPRGFVHNFTYDSLGLLTKDADPAGGSQSLSRTEITGGYHVDMVTGVGRTTSYLIENLPTGDQRRTNTLPDGTKKIALQKTDGSAALTLPDGTVVNDVQGPDPRFGMQSPLLASMVIATPGGITMNVGSSRTVSLSDPANPLSITTLTETMNRNGQTYTMTYNAATRTFTNTTPVGRQGTAKIDSLGRITQNQLSGLNAQQYSYDAHGHLSGMTQGSGTEVRSFIFQYNPQGYLSSITDPLSNVLSFEYDQAGRIKKGILPGGREIVYTYDSNGNVTSVTPPGRPTHSFKYSPVDLMTEYDSPDVGSGPSPTQFSYDIDRQITQILRPDGQTITFSYDTGGRLSAITSPDGPLTYTYDPLKGYPTGITTPAGNTLSYTGDGMLPASETWAGDVTGSVSWTHDSSFHVTGISIDGGNTISYQYDNDGLITKAGDLTVTRNAQNGFLTGTSLGNVNDTWAYDSFGEPASYVARYNTTEIFNQQLTYDKLGRVTDKIETIGGTTDIYNYTYDAAGRLTTVTQNSVTAATYTYDSNGNRLSQTGSGGTVNGTYDNQDRLTQYGSTVYSYTANGELKTKTTGTQTVQYDYDFAGNLKKAILPDGTVIEYVVDGMNRRIGKKVNGTWARKFLYSDRLKPIAELDGSNNIISIFVYGTSTIIPKYMVKGGIAYRIVTDYLGSPRLVVNVTDGTIAQRMDYDEFGNTILDTNPGFQPFGFAGGIYDPETGLVRFGSRDYDPEVGRWTTKDPLGLSAGTNVYVYAGGDPMNLIDPTGKDSGLWYYRLADLLAGAGDALTTIPFTDISLTKWLRKEFNLEDAVDPCSLQYKGGKYLVKAAQAAKSVYDLAKWANAPLYPSELAHLGNITGHYGMEKTAQEIANDLPSPASVVPNSWTDTGNGWQAAPDGLNVSFE